MTVQELITKLRVVELDCKLDDPEVSFGLEMEVKEIKFYRVVDEDGKEYICIRPLYQCD